MSRREIGVISERESEVVCECIMEGIGCRSLREIKHG